MTVNTAYIAGDDEDNKRDWATRCRTDIVHDYDDAIDLTGNGWYNISLLAVMSLAIFAMAIEIFGFSVILTGASCEYNLDLSQTSTLLTVTFIGPIIMAYPWGYLCDTRGRKQCLIVSLWASFVLSAACAFSPNWITMAILKLISSSFVSCAHSITFTLLGESCPKRVRDSQMLCMTAILDLNFAAYLGVAHLILSLKFSYNLGLIIFTPWRLLAILLALPLGISAFSLHFFYESPKFLHNIGKEQEAMDALRGIYRRNGGDIKNYPVRNIYLNEVNHEQRKDINIFRSLWEQIEPQFKPPLLWRTLQLYYLTLAVFSTNNSYFVWFPFLAKQFVTGLNSGSDDNPGLCNVIVNAYRNTTETAATLTECSTEIDIGSVYTSLVQGLSSLVLLLSITRFAHRKRLLVIIILFLSSVCAVLAAVVKENITSIIMFLGMLMNELTIGIILSYFVDLYPTSYRGTACCLATMVARISSVSGIALLGSFIMSHCDVTFYVSAALMIGGALVGFLLPPDIPRK